MFVYWTMFAVPALFAMLTGPRRDARNALNAVGLFLVFLLFAVLIGFRYGVGADWGNYEEIIGYIGLETYTGAIAYGDPGFNTVAWLSTRIGADIYGANLVCGIILTFGLIRFSRRQDNVWLAIAAAVPYLVIVVGMGYVRQGAAIGFLLAALASLERGANARCLGWIFAAAMFHGTSLIVLPFVALALVRKRLLLIVPAVLVSVVLLYFLLQSRFDVYQRNYIEAEYDSSGALVRLVMNAVPALLFLIYRQRFAISETARALWLYFSVASLLLVAIVFASPSTTIIDRIGLYFIPLQLFVFGNLAQALRMDSRGRTVIVASVLLYYTAILFVWLNYATHAQSWVPYRFLPSDLF